MNFNFSINSYVASFCIRIFIAFINLCISFVGLGVIVDNFTGNDFIMKEANRDFEISFFSLTGFIELATIIHCIILFCRQRKMKDLSRLFSLDSKVTCVIILFRIGGPVSLSIFVITKINQVITPNIRNRVAYYDDTRRKLEWETIERLTIVILTFQIVHLVVIIVGLNWQPLSFAREVEFSGVITDTVALRHLESMRQEKQNNAKRLEEVKQKNEEKLKQQRDKFHYQIPNQNYRFLRNVKEVDIEDVSGHSTKHGRSENGSDPYA